jgi:hypothetical protein
LQYLGLSNLIRIQEQKLYVEQYFIISNRTRY